MPQWFPMAQVLATGTDGALLLARPAARVWLSSVVSGPLIF